MKNISIRQKIWAVISNIIAIFACFIILFPIYWLVRTSVIPAVKLFEWPPQWIVLPTFDAYIRAFSSQHLLARTITSLIVSIISTFFSVLIGAMAAYAIARFGSKRKRNLTVVILFLRMIPAIAVLLPIFLMYSNLKLIDTYGGLMGNYIASSIPMVIWMMYGYFLDVPKDIEESAYIDGSGYMNTFLHIVLPITKPALASVAILSFTGTWNEYMMATILTRNNVMTLPVAVASLMNQNELVWDNIAAGGVVLSIPVLLLCIFAQKFFIQGLTVGAVKG